MIIAKTISGFMNSEGGTLLIGVADDGTVTGLDGDYATLTKSDRDGYELFLTQLIADKITGPSPSLCRVSYDEAPMCAVCCSLGCPLCSTLFWCDYPRFRFSVVW